MSALRGTATAVIDSPIGDVYAFLADVERGPTWQDGMKQVTATERDEQGRVVRAEVVIDAKVKQIKTTIRFDHHAPDELAFTQERGDLKTMRGAWKLRSLEDHRAEVTYELELDPGRVLGMLIRGPVEGQLRAMLVDARPQELASALS